MSQVQTHRAVMKKKVALEDTVPGVPVGDFVEEFLTKPTFDADGVQVSSGIKADGKEYGDPVPMSPPVGLRPPEDLMTTIRRMVHHEAWTKAINEAGFDTFEEAGDYDVEDDADFMDELTPYEALFYPPDESEAAGKPSEAEAVASGSDKSELSSAAPAKPPEGSPNSTST